MLMRIGYAAAIAKLSIAMKKRGFKFVRPTIGYPGCRQWALSTTITCAASAQRAQLSQLYGRMTSSLIT
jgi:hypothetical protein